MLWLSDSQTNFTVVPGVMYSGLLVPGVNTKSPPGPTLTVFVGPPPPPWVWLPVESFPPVWLPPAVPLPPDWLPPPDVVVPCAAADALAAVPPATPLAASRKSRLFIHANLRKGIA